MKCDKCGTEKMKKPDPSLPDPERYDWIGLVFAIVITWGGCIWGMIETGDILAGIICAIMITVFGLFVYVICHGYG